MKYILSWLIFPLPIWVVGLLFESRLVPVWRHQSRAFIPGDLCLGPMIVSLWAMPTTIDIGLAAQLALLLPAIALGGVVLTVLRKGDWQNYAPKAMRSPTKVTHDLMGYFMTPAALTWLGSQKIWGCFLSPWPGWAWDWGRFAALGAAYAACVLWDARRGFTSEDVEARHPANWKPIWRRR